MGSSAFTSALLLCCTCAGKKSISGLQIALHAHACHGARSLRSYGCKHASCWCKTQAACVMRERGGRMEGCLRPTAFFCKTPYTWTAAPPDSRAPRGQSRAFLQIATKHGRRRDGRWRHACHGRFFFRNSHSLSIMSYHITSNHTACHVRTCGAYRYFRYKRGPRMSRAEGRRDRESSGRAALALAHF